MPNSISKKILSENLITSTFLFQVCGSKSNGRVRKEYFADIARELERRHFMEEKIKWDFRALDVENKGRLALESALFLFKAVHGERFSQRFWNMFVESRLDPYGDVYFDEIKLFLCNIPDFASGNGNEEFQKQQHQVREKAKMQLEDELKILMKLQVFFGFLFYCVCLYQYYNISLLVSVKSLF